MLNIIMGLKGSGKTKAFIEKVNQAVHEEKGNVICITKGNRHILDIVHHVRLVDTSDFAIDSYHVFYGFIAGMISGNFDISHIFIDSITKIADSTVEDLPVLIEALEKISEEFTVDFTITISEDVNKAPEAVKKHLIQF